MTNEKFNYLLLSILCGCVCLILISLMGCGFQPCPQPRSVTGPVRTLKTVLVLDRHSADQGPEFIESCGKDWFSQTGIQIEVVKTIQIGQWQANTWQGSLDELKEIVGAAGVTRKGFDIVIGVGTSSINAMSSCVGWFVPIPQWMGVIDDPERRWIRVQRLECWYLQHEIAHAFILSQDHSDTGLMVAVTMLVAPGVNIADSCLSGEDFSELLRNKFRDFNKEIR